MDRRIVAFLNLQMRGIVLLKAFDDFEREGLRSLERLAENHSITSSPSEIFPESS
ncbi:MAG: hypothetical protein ACK401_04225 [Archaeoglobaceae archaeon]